jgi:phosphatidylserine decarboxylase
MNFAREGYHLIAIAAIIAAATFAAAVARRSWPIWLLAFALALVAIWVASFFRDPERTGERGDSVVISPADGKVVLITDVDEPTFFGGKTTRVSIFMNVFNVHVNRYPIAGTVRLAKHSPGSFLNAADERASLENEQTTVGIEAGGRKVMVRQIAGLIARRIVNYAKEGTTVAQGDRMGLIRFGSRVDVFVPVGSTIKVKVGDLTVAGQSVVAELPPR